jgi:versiconal hemiacetal acetate esterase
VVLTGGSAGANLAFGVALRLIDAGLGDKVKGILALVPATVHPDAVPDDKNEQYTSLTENANYSVNTLASMKCFLESYGAPPLDKYFSVLLHPRLDDLKKVYIVECGTDTLRYDARLMREALGNVGASVMYDAYPGYPRYFWAYPSPVLAKTSELFHANMFRALEWLDSE